MEFKDLIVEYKDAVAVITLNLPEKLNPLTEMRKNLLIAATELARDDNVRVIIVIGAGRAFSAGGDVESMKARIEGTYTQTRYERLRETGYGQDIFFKIDKPVIAAINGVAVGAGFSLALTCDIRIASEIARFGSVFISRGLVPDCSLTYFLPRVVGTSKALEMMFTGKIIDAHEAKQLGIVSEVVRHEELMDKTLALATEIAAQPPNALELTKKLVYRSMLDDISRHMDLETYAQQMCMRTEDFRESVAAFLEKKPQPKFTGKPAPPP